LVSKHTPMKHSYFLLSIITFLGFSSIAQNFTFNPAQHIDEEIQEENYSSHGISLITTDLSPIQFQWSLIENTLPEEWSYSLCDLGGCYVGIPGEGTMSAITEQEALDGVTAFLKLNITASTFYGEGDVSFYVYESGNQAFGDTISMHLTWTNPSSSIIENSLSSIEVFPNPANRYINFTNFSQAGKVEILTMNGQLVSILENDGSTAEIDLINLPDGVYFAKITNASGESVIRTIVKSIQ